MHRAAFQKRQQPLHQAQDFSVEWWLAPLTPARQQSGHSAAIITPVPTARREGQGAAVCRAVMPAASKRPGIDQSGRQRGGAGLRCSQLPPIWRAFCPARTTTDSGRHARRATFSPKLLLAVPSIILYRKVILQQHTLVTHSGTLWVTWAQWAARNETRLMVTLGAVHW